MKESDDDVDNMIGDSAACGVTADAGSSSNGDEHSGGTSSYHNQTTSCDAVNSSHSKIKQLICNTPNGVTVQVNNNLSCASATAREEVQTMPTCIDCNRVNGSVSTLECRVNGLHLNGNSGSGGVNGAGSLLTNNVNCCPTPKSSVSVGAVFSSLQDNLSANCDARLERRSSADRRGARWRDNSSSSDTGNEGEDCLSADECCIYTYKGDQMADLPSSFFRLDGNQAVARVEPRENHERHSRSSSPEMDFLEMDFDPGPSNEQDSDQYSDRDSLRDDEMDMFAEIQENNVVETREEDVEDLSRVSDTIPLDIPFTPRDLASERSTLDVPSTSSASFDCRAEEHCLGQVQGSTATRRVWAHYGSTGELCPPGEPFSPGDPLVLDEPRRIGTNGDGDVSVGWFDDEPLESAMVWTEEEARSRQVTQIGPSACGATAVINALAALGIPFCVDRALAAVETRARRNAAPLADYLTSRSEAGAAHDDLARGIDAGSAGLAATRFFPLFPRPPLPLAAWLARWIARGSVPIATLNLQRGVSAGSAIPDAWHHQMVFGAGGGLVRLTNPLETVREEALWPQLASPAVLRVRRADVTTRWQASADLRPLATEPRWRALNVLGQVVNVIREHVASTASQGHVMTQYVTIPACYTSGITLVVVRDSPVHHELLAAPDLVSRR